MDVINKEILLDELTRFYYHVDVQVASQMSREQTRKYHEKLLELDALKFAMSGDRLLGYVSYYRINYEQLGRVICHENLNVYNEDVVSGNICWLTDITIDPDYRLTDVIKKLKLDFFEKNQHCDYFIGQAIYKRSQPVRVFKQTEFMKRYLRGV